jgi:hypothetical protein
MQSHSRRGVASDLHYLCQQRACIEIQYRRGLTGTLGGAYGVVGFRGVKDAPKSVLIADAFSVGCLATIRLQKGDSLDSVPLYRNGVSRGR